MPDNARILEALARQLVLNHLYLSFENGDVERAHKQIIRDEERCKFDCIPRKVIVVVGAGR